MQATQEMSLATRINQRIQAHKQPSWTQKLRLNQLAIMAAVFVATILLATVGTTRSALNQRFKRSLYELPDGAEFLLTGSGNQAKGQLKTTFSCDGLGYGYYADPDNDCKIFHICQSFRMSDGSIYNNHWSFICGNQTVFNQVTLSCSHPEDAVPCENAKDFYHVNDYFGDLQAPSVKQNDLDQAQDLVSRAYGSRISNGPSNAITTGGAR